MGCSLPGNPGLPPHPTAPCKAEGEAAASDASSSSAWDSDSEPHKAPALDVPAVVNRVRDRVTPAAEGEAAVRELFAGDDIVLECRQSLRCPITCRRPALPAKGPPPSLLPPLRWQSPPVVPSTPECLFELCGYYPGWSTVHMCERTCR